MNELNPTVSAKRPTLLTVICILSFIAGLWSLWGGIEGAFTNSAQEDLEEARIAIEGSMAEVQGPGAEIAGQMMEAAMDMAERSAANAKPMGYSNIVLALLSLVGVWLMWNLKRNGFWLYLVASIGGLVMPFVFLGGGLLTALSVGMMGLFTILFIILYAVNLKHMH